MENWQVESFRLTMFRTSPINSVEPLWETVTGEKAEKVDAQPRVNMISESGTIELGLLSHISDPFRINLTLSPSQEQQMKTSSFPVLGDLVSIKKRFVSLISDWIVTDVVQEINRIALGSVSFLIKDDKKSAYEQLASFLHHVDIDVESSSDVFYQINRPIPSTTEPNIVINRLSKWSVAQTLGVGFVLGEKTQVIEGQKTYFGTRLELDINTSQHNKETFTKEKLKHFLNELDQIIDQISSEGDK